MYSDLGKQKHQTCKYTKLDNVRTECIDEVFVVTIERPQVRNAIDGPTAAALAQAFRSFDADASLSVAVLTGAGGTFCSGAGLTAASDDLRGLHVAVDGDAPLGVS